MKLKMSDSTRFVAALAIIAATWGVSTLVVLVATSGEPSSGSPSSGERAAVAAVGAVVSSSPTGRRGKLARVTTRELILIPTSHPRPSIWTGEDGRWGFTDAAGNFTTGLGGTLPSVMEWRDGRWVQRAPTRREFERWRKR